MTNHDIYMDMTLSNSLFSKCQYTQVGALAVNENGRIIANGVNGTLPGSINCNTLQFDNRDDHVAFTHHHEIHAEANLILELATSSVTFEQLTIYLTISPCPECFKLLLGLTRKNKYVKKIIYNQRYHRVTNEVLDQMKTRAIKHGTQLLSLSEANEIDHG